MLGACGMQKCHQEALKKNRVSLAKQLVLKELMEHLIEKDVITEAMMEMIQVQLLLSATGIKSLIIQNYHCCLCF